MQQVTPSRRRTITVNKSCISCRARKVKCDAARVGIPCSICASRQSAEDCRLPNRKDRTRKIRHVAASRGDKPEVYRSDQSEISSSADCQDTREIQVGPDLLYLDILNQSIKDDAESQGPRSLLTTTGTRSNAALPQQRLPYTHLNDVDNEYLVRKGVYDLPHPQQLEALIQTYLDHVYPYAPVINRADFVRQYRSGHCSLFLLYAILTPATLNASTDALSACGFSSRSDAQESFFTKATLLHDFATDSDPLLMLQGSIALCMVIPDRPTDKDFGYWFHNAARIATKLDIRSICIREDKSPKVVRLYRRIWWALHSLDIFHVFANTKRTKLLESNPKIKPRHENDWETDDLSSGSGDPLTTMTPQQRASSVVYCELSRIFEECLATVTKKRQQDPRRLLVSLEIWRKSLPAKLHVENDISTNVYYLSIQAVSYRYECSLCRLVLCGLEGSIHDDWTKWTNQRLRTAILELDTIAVRVLASGSLQCLPIFFITTITMLLALHIEASLNANESDLARSMSRISISQIMLVLSEGRKITVFKRALPIFEEILAKKKLHWTMPEHDQIMMHTHPQRDAYGQTTDLENAHRVAEGNSVPQMHDIDVMLESAPALQQQQQQFEADVPFDPDLSGIDFLYDWSLGNL